MVCRNPTYVIKYVIQMVKDKYVFEIRYGKVWYGLKHVVVKVYGTGDDSMKKFGICVGIVEVES